MNKDEYTQDLELDENETQEAEADETFDESEEAQPEFQAQPEKDWKAEALKLKAILDRNKNKKQDNNNSRKSDDLDYGKKAFLTANGIKGNDEFTFVKEELKKSGQDLETLLENDYFQSRLDKFRAIKKTENAIPTGSRSNGVPTDSVEYWASKPIDQVPADMRIKVVNHQIAKEKNKGTFYNS